MDEEDSIPTEAFVLYRAASTPGVTLPEHCAASQSLGHTDGEVVASAYESELQPEESERGDLALTLRGLGPHTAGGAEDAGLVGVCTESTSFYAEAGGQVMLPSYRAHVP